MARGDAGEATLTSGEAAERRRAARETAHAGTLDVAKLLLTLGSGKVRPEFDAQAAGCRWAQQALGDADALEIGVAGKSVELVGTRTYSHEILDASPASGASRAGALKSEAMRFLAPHALTIENGEAWVRLRRLNEAVLGTSGLHPWANTFLAHVRSAFQRDIRGVADVRVAMGRAMSRIVLGVMDDEAVADATTLFGVVQSPLRRKLLGFLYGSRRDRLYAKIRQALESQGEQSLVALARVEGVDVERDLLLQQVPHWMFTFTGSGTDLLARTLAIVASRPAVLGRARDEIAAAGDPADANAVEAMAWLRACLLETGRLFTPVTRTFHESSRGDLVHYFPLLQRDDSLGRSVHEFRPERWLDESLDAPAAASNLFLRGPRACPGRELILFVCRAAMAVLLGDRRLTCSSERLARDPLPLSFPERQIRFTVAEATS